MTDPWSWYTYVFTIKFNRKCREICYTWNVWVSVHAPKKASNLTCKNLILCNPCFLKIVLDSWIKKSRWHGRSSLSLAWFSGFLCLVVDPPISKAAQSSNQSQSKIANILETNLGVQDSSSKWTLSSGFHVIRWWLITGIPNWTPRFYLRLPKSYQVTFELQQGRLHFGWGLGLFRPTYCAGCVWISGPTGQILAEPVKGRSVWKVPLPGQHRKNLSIKRTSTPGPTKILPKHPLGVQIPFGRNLRNLDLPQVIGKSYSLKQKIKRGDSRYNHHHLGVTRGKDLRPLPQAHEKTRRQTGRTLRRRWWGVIGRGQEGTIAPERWKAMLKRKWKNML